MGGWEYHIYQCRHLDQKLIFFLQHVLEENVLLCADLLANIYHLENPIYSIKNVIRKITS